MSWKYGLILIARKGERWPKDPDAKFGDLTVCDEDVCALVELYSNNAGEYHSFCAAELRSPFELKTALADVEQDGINTWFHNNGKFIWDDEEKEWDWVKTPSDLG